MPLKLGASLLCGLLLENGAELEATDEDASSPLLYAAAQPGNEAVVRLLLDNGAKLEATDGGGLTPLLIAARVGNEAVVRLLLEKGAEIGGYR